MPATHLPGMSPEIGTVWKDLEVAHDSGHLKNTSMLAFAACRAFQQRWLDSISSYEAEWKNPDGKDLDFAVVTRSEPRNVLVAGMIRPLGESEQAVEQTLAGFRRICGEPVHAVPVQPPSEQGAAHCNIPVAPECHYILLCIAPKFVFDSAQELWLNQSTSTAPGRAHFACVVQPDDSKDATEFIHISAESAHD